MRRLGVLAFSFSVLAAGAPGAMAQGFPEPPGHRFGAPPLPPPPPPIHRRKVLRDVGLSDEQVKQIETLRYEADKQKLDLHHGLAKARLDLRRLMDADKPDESAVFAQIDRVGALDTQLKKNRVGLLLKVRGLMTPAQWEKLQAARPFHKSVRRFYQWRGEGPPPLPPAPPPPPPGP
jgi:Spy/CpxP family protein refolding chaperone